MDKHIRERICCLTYYFAPIVIGVVVAGCGGSCGASESARSDSGTPDASETAPGESDVGDGTASAADGGCKPRPLPRDLPVGWEEMQVLGCRFSVYVPSSKEYLPSPLVWEPCTSAHEKINYKCRQIHMDWPSSRPAPYGLAGDHTACVDSNGRVVLQLRKLYELTSDRIGIMTVVVEADGPVRQAFWSGFMSRDAEDRMLGSGTIAPGKSAIPIVALSGTEVTRWEWIGGDDRMLRPPTIFDSAKSDMATGVVYSGSYFYAMKGRQFGVYRWDGTSLGQLGSPGAYGSLQWVGRTLLYALASRPWYALFRWTEQDGARELVGFGDDYSRGAGWPGSDGTDMVWLQGEDGPDGDVMFRNRWIMTSKFSTDPSEIVPRRLTRSLDATIMSASGFIPPPVGCGYAAYAYDTVSRESGLQIVRLSDGAWWNLRSSSTDPSEWWGFPVAITCDEVFSRYSEHGGQTIRRVLLDSLGPPNPPMD